MSVVSQAAGPPQSQPGAPPRAPKAQRGDIVPAAEATTPHLAGLRFYGTLEEVRYASIFFRVWAWVVDAVVMGVILIGTAVLCGYLMYLGRNTDDCAIWHLPGDRTYQICYADTLLMWILGGIVTAMAVALFWFGLVWPIGRKGQCIGRRARRIRVMDRRTHCPIGVREAFWRTFLPGFVALLPLILKLGMPRLTSWLFSSSADIAYFDRMFRSWASTAWWVCGAILIVAFLWSALDKAHQTIWDKLVSAIVVQEPPATYR